MVGFTTKAIENVKSSNRSTYISTNICAQNVIEKMTVAPFVLVIRMHEKQGPEKVSWNAIPYI